MRISTKYCALLALAVALSACQKSGSDVIKPVNSQETVQFSTADSLGMTTQGSDSLNAPPPVGPRPKQDSLTIPPPSGPRPKQ